MYTHIDILICISLSIYLSLYMYISIYIYIYTYMYTYIINMLIIYINIHTVAITLLGHQKAPRGTNYSSMQVHPIPLLTLWISESLPPA